MELDQFDANLLNVLQMDNLTTGQRLSELTNLSPASCLRRVQRLRSEGVIVSDVSVVSPDVLPAQVSVVVLVTIEGEQRGVMEAFRQAVKSAPEVRQCYYVSGEADFVLVVSVASLEKYDDFINRFLREKNIRRFVSLVALNRVKFDTRVTVLPTELM